MDFETSIERFIVEEIMLGSQEDINPDQSLITDGILDSLALLRLIAFIEDQFDVEVNDDEVIPENFQTINEIKNFVQQKRKSTFP